MLYHCIARLQPVAGLIYSVLLLSTHAHTADDSLNLVVNQSINLFAALYIHYTVFTKYMFIPMKLQDAIGHKPLICDTWF